MGSKRQKEDDKQNDEASNSRRRLDTSWCRHYFRSVGSTEALESQADEVLEELLLASKLVDQTLSESRVSYLSWTSHYV